ncbi:MAG: hypothetical protein V5A79_06430 [Candidatus Bipolaricaulota bacterium]
MKKLTAVVIVFLLVFGVIAGSSLAVMGTEINNESSEQVSYEDDGLHIAEPGSGPAGNPIRIGGSGQT